MPFSIFFLIYLLLIRPMLLVSTQFSFAAVKDMQHMLRPRYQTINQIKYLEARAGAICSFLKAAHEVCPWKTQKIPTRHR